MNVLAPSILSADFGQLGEQLQSIKDGGAQCVHFDVMDGEFLSILGPSGCGKTTILRILIGLLEPTGDRVFKDGEDITDNPPASRGMGIVFQNYALFENMTVLQNIEYALAIRKENKSKEAKRKIRVSAATAVFRYIIKSDYFVETLILSRNHLFWLLSGF